jgi:hypothetical protein
MVSTIIKAVSGISAVQAVDYIPPVNSKIEILKLIIQLVIGIVSVLQIKKNNKNGLPKQ